MSRFRTAMPSVLALVAAAFLGAQPSPSPAGEAAAGKLQTQTNREGAVTVKVTPKNIAPQARTWDFEVTLDAHSAPLDQDLVRMATLIDAGGNPHAPIAWEGDPPGEHHRKGILRFTPLPGETRSLELRVNNVGGIAQRTFRWRLP